MSELAMLVVGLSLGFGLCYWRLEYWRDRAIWAETLESMRVWADQQRQTDWLEHLYKGDE
jgi:hypothetical protein